MASLLQGLLSVVYGVLKMAGVVIMVNSSM